MNVLALAEAWWAQHSIHLDQEPGGDRFGTIIIEGDTRAAPLRHRRFDDRRLRRR